MNFQTLLFRIKALLPLPRVLVGARWASLALFFATMGIFAASIFEARVLKIPFQNDRYIPPIEQKADSSLSIDEFEPIITYNVFDAEISDAVLTEKPELESAKPGKNLKQILSNLQLMGISILQSQYAVCVIRDKREKTEEIFAINDTVFNTGATVRKILSHLKDQKVYLQLGEEVGILTYREEPLNRNRPISSGAKNRRNPERSAANMDSEYSTDGKNFHISSAEVDSQLNDFAKLLNQARMVPYFKRGKHHGYQVKAIDKGSLYEKLGFKNNDVIEEINGEALDSMEKVMGLFKKFRNEREFTIKLSRKGSHQFMNYYID